MNAMNRCFPNVRPSLCVAALALVWPMPGRVAHAQPSPPNKRHDSSDRRALVDRLIADLGANAYQTRTRATSELIKHGPSAMSALARAANSNDYETATRARQLLKVFNKLFFVGVAIDLQPSKQRIVWDEPFSLTVRFTNRAEFPAHLPIDNPTLQSANPQARQVAAALDVADFLTVVGPRSDQPLQCHIDDIRLDDDVFDAVISRADKPPVIDLPPGKTTVHRIDDFNRGWARYKMLSEGSYTIQLVYQPEWSDEELNRAGVGRVVSNIATVVVTKGAPSEVRNATAPAKLSLAIQDSQAIASLTNLSDLPVTINLNLSTDRPTPMANIRWILETGGEQRELSNPQPAEAAADFTRQRLAELLPGDSVVVGRLSMESVARLTTESRSAGEAVPELFARYTNLAGLVWQRDRAPRLVGNPNALKDLRSPLPRSLLTATLTSNRVSLAP